MSDWLTGPLESVKVLAVSALECEPDASFHLTLNSRLSINRDFFFQFVHRPVQSVWFVFPVLFYFYP